LNELSADNASLNNKIAHQSEAIDTLEKDLLFLQAKPNMHQHHHHHALPYPLSDTSLRTPSASSVNDPFSLANHHHNHHHAGGGRGLDTDGMTLYVPVPMLH
jgi:hypothetical protein